MKRHWGKLLLGAIVAMAIAAAEISRFYGNTQISGYVYLFLAIFLAAGFFSFYASSGIWIIEKLVWRRGEFLKDDRHRSISVEDSNLKTKFKITKKQRKNLILSMVKMDVGYNLHHFLFLGLFVVCAVIWSIFWYIGIPVPSYITYVLAALFFVVSVVWGRQIKLLAMKMCCQEALLNYRCGSCLYDLQGLDSEPDGCVVCPECGGAWRLDRCQKCATKLDSVDTDSCQECGWNRPATHEAESEPAR